MALRLPPMQALRAFEAAARTQSLTKAAQSLNLTHGAISHQIKSLESDLGVRLVERAGRGIRLTDEGERFARRVRTAFAELAAAVNEITARANPRQLRVSVVPSFAARWLLPRIGRFVAAYPDIDLDVRANMANVDFANDDADVAIRYGYGDWPGRPRRAPARRPVLSGVQPAHRERTPAGAPRGPRRLPAAAGGRRILEALVRGGGARLAGADARSRSSTTRRTSCRPRPRDRASRWRAPSLLGNDVRNGVLVRLFDIEVPAPRKYYLVYPSRTANSPKLATVPRDGCTTRSPSTEN